MNKHTPGPWKVDYSEATKLTILGLKEESVSYCGMQNEDGDVDEANAKLISAAPELLEALQYIVKWHRENDSGEGELFGRDYVTTAIAAIRKATS